MFDLNKFKESLFDAALTTCQYEFLIDSRRSIWCKFFDDEMIKFIEYGEDIKYNCKYGSRYDINIDMTCDLVRNLFDNLNEFKNK